MYNYFTEHASKSHIIKQYILSMSIKDNNDELKYMRLSQRYFLLTHDISLN